MEWLNLHTSTLDSEAFMDASPPHRSTWLLLLRYCIGQENGGRIEGATVWPDLKCVRLLGVSRADLDSPSELWDWDGQDLRVAFYPLAKEKQVRFNRTTGRNGAKKRWATAAANSAPTPTPTSDPTSSPIGDPSSDPNTSSDGDRYSDPMPSYKSVGIAPAIPTAYTEGKGRERNGKEERVNAREALVFEIVAAYPVRTDQAEAERAVLDAIDAGEDPAVMLSGTRAIAAVIATAPSGARNKFVPSPVRFFRERKYRDDPAVWRSRFEKNAAGVAKSFATEAPQPGLKPKIL